MKKFATSSLAALMAVSAVIPAVTTSAEARNRGRNVALGVLGGAAALAIIAGSSRRAHASDYEDNYDDGDRQCRRWRYRCEDGSSWACRKFDRNC